MMGSGSLGWKGWKVGRLEESNIATSNFQHPTFMPLPLPAPPPVAHRFRDNPHLAHQLRELIREQRLRAVRRASSGLGCTSTMIPSAPAATGRARHRDHLVAQARAV